MERELSKKIGTVVEIIYLGSDNSITQRYIEIRSVSDGVVKAYCLHRKAPRIFRIPNILAVRAVRHVI